MRRLRPRSTKRRRCLSASIPRAMRKSVAGEIQNAFQYGYFDWGSSQDHEDIAPLIVERRGALAILEDGDRSHPLYEGKMFWHFDQRYGTYEGQTVKQSDKGVLPRVPNAKHDDPQYRIEPRYWVDAGLTNDAPQRVPKCMVLCMEGRGAIGAHPCRDCHPLDRSGSQGTNSDLPERAETILRTRRFAE